MPRKQTSTLTGNVKNKYKECWHLFRKVHNVESGEKCQEMFHQEWDTIKENGDDFYDAVMKSMKEKLTARRAKQSVLSFFKQSSKRTSSAAGLGESDRIAKRSRLSQQTVEEKDPEVKSQRAWSYFDK